MNTATTARLAGGIISQSPIDGLVCPSCKQPLEGSEWGSNRGDDTILACDSCGKSWPVVDGIPYFVSEFPYWGEIPLEQMHEVNRRARHTHWKSVLLGFDDPEVQRAAPMITNTARANWQWLVTLPRKGRVLDVGAGMGTNSQALAPHCREVVALEPVAERVRFMRHRFAQEGISNVKILRSSVWDLPFAAESFDLVIMNGVLEWIAEGRSGDPGQLQLQVLQRMFRLLRPGGHIYLGIENRVMLHYLLGYLDPHCRLPWVPILPRRVAHWYARRHGLKNGYRNYLYSSRGYRTLLRNSGFETVETYVVLPSYNEPRYLVPLRNNVFTHFVRTYSGSPSRRLRRLAHGALLRARLLKYLQYSYVILGSKQRESSD